MMVRYIIVVAFCVYWLLWWGCLVGFGRISLSIKSLAALLLGFAVIFAIASQLIRWSNQ